MRAKLKVGDKFIAKVRDLPPELRTNKAARTVVAAQKQVDQEQFILARAKKAADAANAKLKAAEEAAAVAQKALDDAVAAVPEGPGVTPVGG